ncbi:hypothetical protein Nocox_23125 [Nonomuraea coxensis DSM 45129]|uniref:Uncharacterized protein n=1 Tax=Nonomuraea coxensis DSM 45129 TaxID=1122611 RepID=A0ABX8U3I2_9ACTN|nr:hypothetical protein [Nonomuraea coxensis]QYC42229.1 hypothetical protein Nocox_23125 [Nonomuraea coxensis DSM 45129]
MSGPPPAETPAGDGPAPGQDLTRVWTVITHVVTPTTFVAAIMMYIGAVRANTMYARLGVDQSMLGLSFQDYVLRSVALTIEPLILLLVVALIAPPLHGWLLRSATSHPKAMTRVIAVMAVLGAVSVAVGIVAMAGWRRMPFYVVPCCLGLGVFVLVYGISLHQRIHPRPASSPTDQILRRTVCVALLLVLLLWAVTLYAQQRGAEAALRYRMDPAAMPSTVVYAARRLYLEGRGIVETPLPDTTAEYRYRYTGLRLLIHSNQRYFLLPACWATDPWARAVVLPADGSLRLEFSVRKTPPECPA